MNVNKKLTLKMSVISLASHRNPYHKDNILDPSGKHRVKEAIFSPILNFYTL